MGCRRVDERDKSKLPDMPEPLDIGMIQNFPLAPRQENPRVDRVSDFGGGHKDVVAL